MQGLVIVDKLHHLRTSFRHGSVNHHPRIALLSQPSQSPDDWDEPCAPQPKPRTTLARVARTQLPRFYQTPAELLSPSADADAESAAVDDAAAGSDGMVKRAASQHWTATLKMSTLRPR